MNEKQTAIKIADGTSQIDRFPGALREGYINADEMRFEDLLALGADYAGILKFFDLSNQADRTWEPFFISDALVLFGKILATDLKKIESTFLEVFLKTFDHAQSSLSDVPNYQLAATIDYWLKILRKIESEAGQKLFLVIKGVIEDKLSKPLHALEQFLGQSFIEREFDGIWLKAQANEKSSWDAPNEDEHFLRSNFGRFYNAVSLIQNSAGKLVPQALESRIHSPAIGMYITFIRLFNKVQQKLNRFSRNHLFFYYRDVLKIRPLQIRPDRAYLKFDTDVDNREVLIKAGTEFTAGIDENNNDVIYTADNDLLVFNARVEALYTLYFERDQLKTPEKYLECVTGAKVNEIPVVRQDGADTDKEVPAWPIFGAPRNAAEKRIFEDAELGFALASPVLFLKEGQREINIAFKFASVTAGSRIIPGDVISALIEHIRVNENPADSEKDVSNLKSIKADIFFKVFHKMFTIQLTAENGWYEVTDYLPLSGIVDEQYPEDSLNIQIRLSPKDPPIVPYIAEIHGDGYNTDQPIIRLMINPTSYIYPFTLLDNIVIQAIEIGVDVRGVRDIAAHNNLGQLDANSPFHPFGPLPTIGSYLIIGNQEAAVKQLTRFEVEVEWADLPAEKGCFKEYYQSYENDFANDVFEAGVSVLNGGKWQPAAEIDQPRVKLFESKNDGIAKTCRLSGEGVIKLSRPLEENTAPAEFGYDFSKKDGFFKFTLAAPIYAFGHKDYPFRLTKVLTENARLKKIRLHQPMPNPPYTPLINSISINYGATARVNLEKIGTPDESRLKGRIYHIHPYGVERLSPQTHSNITIVPRYESDGNLFIGLSGRELSGILTLLFHMRDDSTIKSDTAPPAFKWYYLSANRWRRLGNQNVLSDTTNGFLSTGIVTLNIPNHPDGTNTTMPGELFWLRVSLDRFPESPCSVYSINTQAVQVTRQKRESASIQRQAKLPAGTIKESRISIPGIDRIFQIAESSGGRLPEDDEQFITRISERLRHKNRASTPWDFERLILNHFPKIHKAKCFANMVDDPQSWQRPGHILIVVIPFLKHASQTGMKPTVNGLLLKEIEEYVKRLASAFITIKVRNPVYEKIQVRCRVQFRRGAAGGYYLKKLNQAIVDYLSPWNRIGYTSRFDWCVRRYDLKSYIRNLEYIRFATDFSMLRVAEDDNGYFSLFDTTAWQVKDINPHYPWSIAIPFKQHYIETISKAEMIKPDITGINELEIGSNFIIPGNQNHAIEK